MSQQPPRITLYERAGCHLCEEAASQPGVATPRYVRDRGAINRPLRSS
jgi:hypothetical protein